MSAAVLREAAALMRERAEAATAGPWTAEAIGSEGFHVFAPDGSRAPLKGRARVSACTWQDWEEAEASSVHIASWHPAVALAVADWLEVIAEQWCDVLDCLLGGGLGPTVPPCGDCWNCSFEHNQLRALTVARAYLGSDQ